MTDIIGNRDFPAYDDNENFNKLLKSQLETPGPNEDFYEKLVALKNDQKKTLMVMEELYNQKQLLKTEVQKSEATLNDLRKPLDSAPKSFDEYKFRLNTVSAYEDNHVKYPLSTVVLGQAQPAVVSEEQRTTAKPPTCPTRSSVSFQKSVQVVEPDADEPTGDLSSVAQSRMLDSLSEGMKKIETMWDNFSLNEANMNDSMTMRSFDFNDRFERKPRIKTAQPNTKKKSIEIEWVPRVTIPEPFNMSIRDQVRYDSRKDKVMNEMREERERRIEAEIRECKKKFKAKPVPKHVRMPLYEQQRAQDEMRRQKMKEMSRETHDKISTLSAIQQEQMENETMPQQQKTMVKSPNAVRRSQTQSEFTAQPLPSFYFNENADEEIKETEMYKQIQRQMRALEMLKESKLPHNMGLMEEKKRLEIERNQLFVSEMNNLHKELNDKALQQANLRKNHDVPDYDEQFKNFTIQMEKRKAFNRKNTKTVPFHLRSASRTGCRKACDVNLAKTGPRKSAALNRSSSSMSRLNRSLSASMDSMPIKNTESQRLRESVTRSKLNEIARKEVQQEHIDKMKALRAKKLAEQIKEKSNFVPNEVDSKISRQTRKLKLDQRRMEEEYEQSLAEMGNKVNSRKLQIEHIEEENRKKALEKKMNEAMEKLHKLEDYNNKASASSGVQRAKPVSSATYEDNDWINEA